MRPFLRAVVVICSIFTLMAFSCSKKKTIGDPYMLYEVHGTVYGDQKVLDTSTPQEDDYITVTLPLKNIRVSSGDGDPVFTNADGNFTIYGRSNPGTSVSLVFQDDDAAVNGGPYQKLTKTIGLRQRDAGDSGNYRGYWFASGVEVKMLLKSESINPEPTLP